MVKIVRLTEADLTRLVKRVIEEQKMTPKQTGECQEYFRSKGIRWSNDGGSYSTWNPNIPGYYLEGIEEGSGDLYVFFGKEDKNFNKMPMDPNLLNTIKTLVSTMGGNFMKQGGEKYRVGFKGMKCKQYADFCVKLMSLMKQNKK